MCAVEQLDQDLGYHKLMPRKDPDARREYHRNYMRAWYQRNKEKHLGYVSKVTKRRRQEVRDYLIEVKSSPCMDCGVTFPPEAMDFDHLRDKEFMIGRSDRGLTKTKDEIAKCELVCSNCHRVRTMKRRRGIA